MCLQQCLHGGPLRGGTYAGGPALWRVPSFGETGKARVTEDKVLANQSIAVNLAAASNNAIPTGVGFNGIGVSSYKRRRKIIGHTISKHVLLLLYFISFILTFNHVIVI